MEPSFSRERAPKGRRAGRGEFSEMMPKKSFLGDLKISQCSRCPATPDLPIKLGATPTREQVTQNVRRGVSLLWHPFGEASNQSRPYLGCAGATPTQYGPRQRAPDGRENPRWNATPHAWDGKPRITGAAPQISSTVKVISNNRYSVSCVSI